MEHFLLLVPGPASRMHFHKAYYSILALNTVYMHCTENLIYVIPEIKVRGLVPDSYGVPLWLQKNRQTNSGNI
jgi:hypothetical protein